MTPRLPVWTRYECPICGAAVEVRVDPHQTPVCDRNRTHKATKMRSVNE